MDGETILEKIIRIFWHEPINKFEYFFAKKWLDKTFGKQEYWGQNILELTSSLKQGEKTK